MSARELDRPPDHAARTKADTVADELRKSIASGEIPPGTRLYQDQLAARFATSITPVREALRQLEAEGILEGRRHRGAIVSAPDPERVASIYVMRRLVEPFAAQRAAVRMSRQDFESARAINSQLRDAQKAEDLLLARSLNREFHFALYSRCGLPTLVSEIERLWGAFPWSALHLLRRHESPDEHLAILDAMMRNDQPAIRQHFVTHLRTAYQAVSEQLRQDHNGTPFDVAALDDTLS